MRAFLGLGSNIEDRRKYLTDAISSLPNVVQVSPLYETEPIGVGGEQDDYLNCVAEIEWEGTPHELLNLCADLEAKAGRVRTVKNGPRTLDVDVLLVGNLNVHDTTISVPHPHMYERRFVMQPLADIAPEVLPDNWSDFVAGEVRKVEPLL